MDASALRGRGEVASRIARIVVRRTRLGDTGVIASVEELASLCRGHFRNVRGVFW